MDFQQTPKPPTTRSRVDDPLLDLAVELVLGDLPVPAQHHGDQEGVVVLEILVVVGVAGVNTAEVISLIVLEPVVSQASGRTIVSSKDFGQHNISISFVLA